MKCSKWFLVAHDRISEWMNNRPLELFKLIAFLVFLFFSLFKMRGYLLEGRFWAEEGRDFYPVMLKLSFFESLAFLFNGHIEFLTNLVMALATQVPLIFAPLFTVYLSFLIQIIPVVYLISYFPNFGLNRMRLFFLLLFIVALPQSPEVWANSINLHFHMALLVGLMIANFTALSVKQKWTHRILFVMAGLSGIPANFLTPLAIIRAWKSREAERWIQAVVLTSTCLLQAGLLVTKGLNTSTRSFTLHPLIYWFTFLTQHFLGPILGPNWGNSLGLLLREGLRLNGWSILVALIWTLIFGKLLIRVYDHKMQSQRWLWYSAAFLSLLSVFTSLGEPTAMISATGNGRYFFASNILLYMGLLISHDRFSRWVRFGLSVLMLVCLSRVGTYTGGPGWIESLRKAQDSSASTIEVWPKGWVMPISN